MWLDNVIIASIDQIRLKDLVDYFFFSSLLLSVEFTQGILNCGHLHLAGSNVCHKVFID